MKNIIKYSIINSFGTAIYIFAIILLFSYLENILSGNPDTILAPIAMLMLFVFSAAFTGSLVLGRPIIWYLDGKKKDAISLLICTLGIFLILILIVFALLLLLI